MDRKVIYIGAIIIAIGAFPLPYGYYTLLRIVACLLFSWIGIVAFQKNALLVSSIAALFAILFNPLIPVYLSKDIWIFLDIVAAIVALVIGRFINR